MGLGSMIGASGQNQLTNLSGEVNTIGAGLQQYAANTQATADQQQASEVMQQTGFQAEENQVQWQEQEGAQSEQYASSGVEQQGSAIDVVNQTRMLGQEQTDAIVQAGKLQANLLDTQANMSQLTGLSDLLSAQGQNQISQQQNQLNQQQQKNQILESVAGGGLGLVLGLLK